MCNLKCLTWGVVTCITLNRFGVILCSEVIFTPLHVYVLLLAGHLTNWLESGVHQPSVDVVLNGSLSFYPIPCGKTPHFIMWSTFHCLLRETCLLLHPYLGIMDPTARMLGSRSWYSIAARSYAYDFPCELTWSTLDGVKRQAPGLKQFSPSTQRVNVNKLPLALSIRVSFGGGSPWKSLWLPGFI